MSRLIPLVFISNVHTSVAVGEHIGDWLRQIRLKFKLNICSNRKIVAFKSNEYLQLSHVSAIQPVLEQLGIG